MDTLSRSEKIQEAMARSAAYGLLGHALRYPDPAMWSRLSDRARWVAWPEELAKLDSGLGASARAVQEWVFSPDPKATAGIGEIQADYARLFGHAVRGTCPPYELEYGTSEIFRLSSELSDIKGFYTAFGLDLVTEAHERADHASIECEFMSFMAAKEAYAHEHGQSEGLEILRSASSKFLESHLGRFLPSFARRILDADPQGFYEAIGHFAQSFVQLEAQAYDVTIGPELLELRPSNQKEETEQACAVEDFGAGCPLDKEPGLGINTDMLSNPEDQ